LSLSRNPSALRRGSPRERGVLNLSGQFSQRRAILFGDAAVLADAQAALFVLGGLLGGLFGGKK
jgi:hypothetical protein